MKARNWDRVLWALLALSSLTGFFLFDDYGIGWDEPLMRDIGLANYEYVTGYDDHEVDYATTFEKFYGVGVELPLVAIEKGLGLTEPRSIYLMRHLVTHLFLILGAACLYLWVRRVFHSRGWAALAFALWMLTPVMFAHSFLNSKDLPFACVWCACLLLMSVALEKNEWKWWLLLGVALGYLMNIRIMGLLLVLCAAFFVAVDLVAEKERRKQRAIGFLLMLVVSFLLLWVTWPWLWGSPLQHFKQAFENMSAYIWDKPVLFMGSSPSAPDLPWFFGAVSFATTVPLLYLLSGLGGIVWLGWKLLRQPGKYFLNGVGRNLTLALMCCVGPMTAIVIFDSVIYDHWRHLFFIWPGFLFLAVWMMRELWQWAKRWRAMQIALVALLTLQVGEVLVFMVRTHPNEQVYFNQLVPQGDEFIRRNFEYDYWGASYRAGVEYILAHDDRPLITYSAELLPISFVQFMLSPTDRDRSKVVRLEDEPDYFLSTFRWHPGDYAELGAPWKNFSVNGSAYLSIWKLR